LARRLQYVLVEPALRVCFSSQPSCPIPLPVISDADTPGYKARDLNFDAALHFATNTPPLRTTNHQHFAFPAAPGAPPFQFQRPELQPSLDGNSVDAHAERAAFGRAALEYRASVNFIEGKVHTLMTAITGQ